MHPPCELTHKQPGTENLGVLTWLGLSSFVVCDYVLLSFFDSYCRIVRQTLQGFIKKILPFQCQKYHYFPEIWSPIFWFYDLFVTFYVGSGTVMHFGSGFAKAKNYGSCGSYSTTLLSVPMLTHVTSICTPIYSGSETPEISLHMFIPV